MNKKKIYIIWIWGIWVSAIARYYLYLWWEVYGNDKVHSELVNNLKIEWVNISPLSSIIDVDKNIDLIVYTEAIPENNKELILSKKSWIKTISYPEALAEITNNKKLISIAWTHWKSTTASLTSIVLKDSDIKVNAVIWTILKEFWNKNTYWSHPDQTICSSDK